MTTRRPGTEDATTVRTLRGTDEVDAQLLPPLDATSLTVAPVTPAKLLAERDAFLPDSPPHEILHVPKV